MDIALESPDWSLLQSFLAVAETGSLSAAARRLGTSQPTIGRHIQALESQLGASLFNRQPKGMALSDAGVRLLGPAREMHDAANRLSLSAVGEGEGMQGTVRVTASVFVAHHHLPGILAKVRKQHPEIALEIVASDTSENLLFREADIAVRMYRPQQLDMVSKHIGDIALGIFASPDYLSRRGTPTNFEDYMGHELIGYDRNDDMIRGMRALGLDVSRDAFPVRCDHHAVLWELVAAGMGLGIAQRSVGDNDLRVVSVMDDAPLPGLPVWLTTHPAIRRVPRVDLVWNALAEGLTPILAPPGSLLSPDEFIASK